MQLNGLRVVLVLRSVGEGGVEKHVCQLAAQLKSRAAHVTILALCERRVASQFQVLGVDIVQLQDVQEQSIKAFKNVFALYGALRRLRPDVVHLHGIRPIFVGGLVARMARVPRIVSTMHGSPSLMALKPDGHVSRPRMAFSRFMHAVGVFLAHVFLTISWDLRREAHDCMMKVFGRHIAARGERRIRTIHHGIDEEFFAPVARKIFDRGDVVVGVVARLDPKKGLEFLLDALASLRRRGLNVRALLVGDGSYRSHYEEYVRKLALTGAVEFAGHRDDIRSCYRAMDILVLPSLLEGLGLVVLEAMAQRVPVVATNVGGVPELVNDRVTGLLVPSADATAIEMAVLQLIEDEVLRTRLIVQAAQYVETHHQEKEMFEQIFATYRC